MASRAISGKPGAGKSFLAVTWLITELLETERPIVTNLELDFDGIAVHLGKLGRSDIDPYKRITRIQDSDVSAFWRHRGNGCVLPDISDADIKAGIRPEPKSFEWPVAYYLDELHKFLNARQWMQTGPLLLWYITQHRHFGDDVVWVTQFVEYVDKQFRAVTQDYTYARNLGKEKFRGFTKGGKFVIETYLEPNTKGSKAVPQETKEFKPDFEGIGKCYHTSIAHGEADKGKRAKGLSIWWLYAAIVAIACLLSWVAIKAPYWFFGVPEHPKKVEQPVKVGEIGGTYGSKPSPKGGAPLNTPALEKEIFNVAVVLKGITSGEVVQSFAGRQQTNDIFIQPSPFGNSVLVTGTNLQNVMATAESVKMMDCEKPDLVMIQGVILRTTKGAGSSVGVWSKFQEIAKAGGLGLGNLAYDPVSGVLTFGTIQGAKDAIGILGSNDVSRYGFSVESQPMLATVSGQEAWLTSGKEVPIPVTTQAVTNAQTSVQYKRILFSLGVRPSVLPDGRIALSISQTNDDVLSTAQVGGNATPTISTQSLYTRIELVEGQVAILGGIRVSNRNDEKTGFPLLSEFPPLSWLFGNRKKSNEDSELVIALTAYRVPPDANPLPVRRALPVRTGKTASGGSAQIKKKEQILCISVEKS